MARDFPAICLTGPRQTGKSTLLKKLFPNHNYYTLDDPILKSQFKNDPKTSIDMLKRPCIIDEIQYVPEILPYLKIIIDSDRKNGEFILSGSQMFVLMQGLSESLAGRVGICELLGLSYKERIKHCSYKSTPELLKNCLLGSYPETAIHGVSSKNFYSSYLQTYLERDLRQIRSVHDISLFQRFLELIAARAGSVLNISELGSACGVSHTISRQWLTILESTRIVYLLRPYFTNLSKRLVKSPKIYFTDTGLLCYLLKYSSIETLWASPSCGHVFENEMISLWLKEKINTNAFFDLYYLRDSKGKEVDLLIDHGEHKEAYEFKLGANISNDDCKGLIYFQNNIKYHANLISTYDNSLQLKNNVTATPWFNMLT